MKTQVVHVALEMSTRILKLHKFYPSIKNSARLGFELKPAFYCSRLERFEARKEFSQKNFFCYLKGQTFFFASLYANKHNLALIQDPTQ